MKDQITINLKFFSDLNQETNLKDYDYLKGVTLTVNAGTRLRSVLKSLAFKKKSHHLLFLNGEPVGIFKKLKDGDQVTCIRPGGGG